MSIVYIAKQSTPTRLKAREQSQKANETPREKSQLCDHLPDIEDDEIMIETIIG